MIHAEEGIKVHLKKVGEKEVMNLSSYISSTNCSTMLIEVSKHAVDKAPCQNIFVTQIG